MVNIVFFVAKYFEGNQHKKRTLKYVFFWELFFATTAQSMDIPDIWDQMQINMFTR